MAMLRPGIHFHNGCKITAADVGVRAMRADPRLMCGQPASVRTGACQGSGMGSRVHP
jgi:hypothetical protein